MEKLIFPIILFLAGCYFLFRNISMVGNDDKIKNYLETSPKGKLWVDKMGIEKTMNLTRKVFLPIGIFAAACMIGYSCYLIWLTL